MRHFVLITLLLSVLAGCNNTQQAVLRNPANPAPHKMLDTERKARWTEPVGKYASRSTQSLHEEHRRRAGELAEKHERRKIIDDLEFLDKQ